MIKRKIWALHKLDATTVDATFLFGLGCEVEVVLPEPQTVTSADGKQWRYAVENPFIRITTTCDKQESMLKLKYGEELLLLQVYHTMATEWTPIPGI